jgi:hypothetical protein
MEKLRPLLIILFVLCTSCQKEILNKHDFVGLWIEKGKIGGCTIEFTCNGSAFLNLYSNNNVQEYAFRFDEDANKIFFSLPDNPNCGWSLRYSYDDTSKELTIWGLYLSNLEIPSKTILTKV